MIESLRKPLWSRSAAPGLLQSITSLPGHGDVLVVACPPGAVAIKRNAVWDALSVYADGTMPQAALLLDLASLDYRFSSADLTGVMSSVAAWTRGWVAPCAIVLQGASADELARMLEVTRLNEVEAVAVVPSPEGGFAHIRRQLEKLRDGPSGL